ncbi:MAG: FAD-binding oxidoreductase [Actinobacteria bacterium]|nr:FAD-binding oxidoreductase [Actinomycetota bacterium]MCB9388994.1 FAD-binding oxidoreductase [Acidimicrobiia bacterium]
MSARRPSSGANTSRISDAPQRFHRAQGPVADLEGIVGRDHVLTDAVDVESFATDWTGRFRGTDVVVVRPANPAEAIDVLAYANAVGFPVQLQGGNTGLVGGSQPLDHALVLSTRRLSRIDLSMIADGLVIAEAGVTLSALRDAVGPYGWDPGLDMASRDSATVGGMAATNAGGIEVLAHGMMSSRVIGLEAVAVDGSPISRLRPILKDNAGPRLDRLLLGSEGSFGLITRVLWKLTRRCPERLTCRVEVSNLDSAVSLVRTARNEITGLIAAEAWDAATSVASKLGTHDAAFGDRTEARGALRQAMSDPTWTVLLEWDMGQRDETLLEPISHWLADSAIGIDASARSRLWNAREDAPLCLARLGTPVKADIGFPIDRISAALTELRGGLLRIEPDWCITVFGHLGDGNLHVNAVGPGSDDVERSGRYLGAALATVLDLDGTVSAEHGLGRTKAGYLDLARPDEAPWIRRLKNLFDPNGQLNGGVLGLGCHTDRTSWS